MCDRKWLLKWFRDFNSKIRILIELIGTDNWWRDLIAWLTINFRWKSTFWWMNVSGTWFCVFFYLRCAAITTKFKLNANQDRNYVRSRRRECKQKDHHFGGLFCFFLVQHFCIPPDTITLFPLFAIFNVNLTPNKCPRKQTHPTEQRKKDSSTLFSVYSIFLTLSAVPRLTKWQFFRDAAKCFLIQFSSWKQHPSAKFLVLTQLGWEKEDFNVLGLSFLKG